eukprot:s82_g27.t1
MRSLRKAPTASALGALPALAWALPAALAWSSLAWIGSGLRHPRRGAPDLVVRSLPGAAEEPASGAANSSSYVSRPNWRKRYRRVLPFDEARRCVQAIGFGSREEWDEWVSEGKKSPFLGPYVPNDPEAMYAEEWQGWDDFLGCILPFSKARLEAWYTFVEDDPVRLRSLRLPALPSIYYSSEWQGYEDTVARVVFGFIGVASAFLQLQRRDRDDTVRFYVSICVARARPPSIFCHGATMRSSLFPGIGIPFLAAAWTPPELSPTDDCCSSLCSRSTTIWGQAWRR